MIDIERVSNGVITEAGVARPSAYLRSPVAAGLAGKVAEIGTLILLVSLVPRTLGPERYGSFSVALALVTLGSAAVALGGPGVMSRFIPAVAPAERAALARALALRALRWRALQFALFAAAAAGAAALDPGRFPPVQAVLIVVALACDVGATLAFQVALGLGRASAWSFRYPAQQALLVVGAVTLGRLAGATGAVAAVAVASGVVLGLGLSQVGALRGAHGGEIPPGVTRFALLNGIGGLLVQFVQRAGVVAVVLLAGSRAQAGFAGLAAGVGLAATYVVSQVFTVELPRLSVQARQDLSGAEAAAQRLAERAAAVLVPLAVLAVPVAAHAIPLAAGARFRGSLPALGPALALLPLAPLTALGAQLAALRLRPGVRVTAGAAGVVAFTASAGALVPADGALGATLALLAGTAATAVWLVWAFRDRYTRALLGLAGAGTVAVLALAALTS